MLLLFLLFLMMLFTAVGRVVSVAVRRAIHCSDRSSTTLPFPDLPLPFRRLPTAFLLPSHCHSTVIPPPFHCLSAAFPCHLSTAFP